MTDSIYDRIAGHLAGEITLASMRTMDIRDDSRGARMAEKAGMNAVVHLIRVLADDFEKNDPAFDRADFERKANDSPVRRR